MSWGLVATRYVGGRDPQLFCLKFMFFVHLNSLAFSLISLCNPEHFLEFDPRTTLWSCCKPTAHTLTHSTYTLPNQFHDVRVGHRYCGMSMILFNDYRLMWGLPFTSLFVILTAASDGLFISVISTLLFSLICKQTNLLRTQEAAM